MRLSEIKKLCEEATEGPWRGDRYDGSIKYQAYDGDDAEVIHTDEGIGREDGLFICAARTELPRLVEWVERARQLLRESQCLECYSDYTQEGEGCSNCADAKKLLAEVE